MEESEMSKGQGTECPEISVVIASVNGPDYVDACLKSLRGQTFKGPAEVIVADCCGDGVTELIRRNYPEVTLLSFESRKTIPELRAIGMKNARGKIIALTEDHCVADPTWFEGMYRAHQTYHGAIGGAVENDPSIKGAVDWSVYFCEYSKYLNPVPTGEVSDIPGNNTSYRREFLDYLGGALETGLWENFLNAKLQEHGVKLFSDPSIVVYHRKCFGFRYFLSQRYHYARSFAGMRTKGASLWRRLVFAAFSPLLPALLIGRIGWRVLTKRRHLGRFFQALPFLAVFTLSWAVGEFVGYLFGAGESLMKVE